MKLPVPFIKLPIRFDVARLQQELEQFSGGPEWAAHPLNYKGNSAIRLISARGEENDDVAGEMMVTPHLQRCAYVRQVFSAFQSVLTRSRFMRLAPGDIVPPHCDINYHWLHRTRIHIPIVTHPDVRFLCDGEEVHMAAGEAWIFDNWRRHSVENRSDITRVHLVIDTAGSPYFWQMVAQGQTANFDQPASLPPLFAFDANAKPDIATERFGTQPLMPVSEVASLCRDIANDLDPGAAPQGPAIAAALAATLDAFSRSWEALWRIYGQEKTGLQYYRALIQQTRAHLGAWPDQVTMRSNGQSALNIFEVQVLGVAIGDKYLVKAGTSSVQVRGKTRDFFDRPLFIVAAPRSGSTLLFETLACASQLQTIGGESHAVFETIDALNPALPGGPQSNRLTATHATPDVAQRIKINFASGLRDREGNPLAIGDLDRIRLLDKLPKNSLRIPFLQAIFPDALFVYLYRDPWQSISSMLEAWKSGNWVTYPKINAAGLPWSLLLTPEWKEMQDGPLEAVCARQWASSNAHILDDLAGLHGDRHFTVDYDSLLRDPKRVVGDICDFANIGFDRYLRERVAAALPQSRYTQTAPKADKWRSNEAQIQAVDALFRPTWERIQAFARAQA